MKRRAMLCVCSLLFLLPALAFLLANTAEGGIYNKVTADHGWSGGLVGNTDPVTPTTSGGIWGPDVGPIVTGRGIKLTPLPIANDQIAANSTLVSDDFNTCDLDTSIWTFIDPVGDATQAMIGTFTQDAWLSISVPISSSHDIWVDGNFAPRIMQPISDTDFEIEVKFESGLSERYQMQGVLIEQDSDDFLRFEFHSDGWGTRLFAAILEPDPSDTLTATVKYNQQITDTNVAPLYMRVRRQGDQWNPYYSYNGLDWMSPVTFTHALTVTAVGTYASNVGDPPSAAPAHTGYIDYFFNTASPIDPEDSDRNSLTVNTVGNGLVSIAPDKLTYNCGEVVTLTATADPGWSFSGWSGDLSGSNNPETITMDGDKTVTATFSQEEYTLTVNVVGEGTVTKDPDQATYHYSDVVTLTATADPGWTFTGWSGHLYGTENPKPITMHGDKTVTATFTQDEYTLTVNVVGEGTVTKDPHQATYHYGDVVTLTAIPNTKWSFAGWSGDLSGTDNPKNITMDGDKTVTATFIVYRIFLPFISRLH